MNILYFANPLDVLDRKCYEYFSQIEGVKVFLITDVETLNKINPVQLEKLKDVGITILPPFKSFSIKFFYNVILTSFKINRYIRENKIDIVHVLYACPNALWLKYLKGVFKVITTRGSDILITIPKLRNKILFMGLIDRILFALFKTAFTSANFISCTSYKQKEKIYELTGKNAIVIRTGIKIDALLKIKKSEFPDQDIFLKKYILFPRSMCPVYNHEIEVSAINMLEPEFRKRFLFIFLTGINPDLLYKEKIETKLKEIPGLDYKIFDFIEQESLYSLEKGASLVVMVPHSDGTPNSALEAMTFKVPLILGNLDYDEDLFKDSCFKLVNNTPDELAGFMKEALVSYPYELLETGFKRVQEFADWNKEMHKLHQGYSSLTKENLVEGVVIVAGFGVSGSSTVVDLLKEFSGLKSFDTEFRLLVDPDGILSLEKILLHGWTPYQSDLAIKRFRNLVINLCKENTSPYLGIGHSKTISTEFKNICNEYADDITSFNFQGTWYGTNTKLDFWLRKLNLLFNTKLKYPGKNISLSFKQKDFIKLTSRFLKKLMQSSIREENSHFRFIIDEGYASLHSTRILNYFDNSKMIIINRDPRDIYVNANISKYSFLPLEPLNFISWYKYLQEQSSSNSTNPTQVLRINFEEIILRYEESIERICNFLSLDKKLHVNKGKFLKPDVSIKKIGLWKNWKNKKEIELIGEQLKPWCFDI